MDKVKLKKSHRCNDAAARLQKKAHLSLEQGYAKKVTGATRMLLDFRKNPPVTRTGLG